MCGTCGCGEDENVRIVKPGEVEGLDGNEENHLHHHHHHHSPDHYDGHHNHHHEHPHFHGNEIRMEQDILNKNNLLAERNRGYFEAREIVAINLVSSPGSGKTTLLEKTIQALGPENRVFVIEGDQQTLNDARRIEQAGAPVIQINTGSGCHLDAQMINAAVKKLEVAEKSVLMIENVGNLVCPAMFDLGESKRVVIMSVTEGEDKPLKYPNMFQTSQLCIINKTDLLPYVDFDTAKAKEYALRVNHHLEFIELSAKTGEGMESWLGWLGAQG